MSLNHHKKGQCCFDNNGAKQIPSFIDPPLFFLEQNWCCELQKAAVCITAGPPLQPCAGLWLDPDIDPWDSKPERCKKNSN